MVHLVGCRHSVQTFNPVSAYFPRAQASFKGFLRDQILRYSISLVAEELAEPHDCDPNRPNRRPLSSVARDLVNELQKTTDVEHRYCEPCPAEKARLGIGRGLPFIDDPCNRDLKRLIRSEREAHLHDIAHRWPIREKFWVEKLSKDLHREVLFVCGALHRCTFRNRLRELDIETNVITRFFDHDQGLLRNHVAADELAAYRQVRRSGFPPESGCSCITVRPMNGL